MAAVISLKGIDQAIANLDYQNENTLKYRLVHAIRRHYEDKSSIVSIQDIDAEELVKVLWDTGDDPEIIKSKRKNLSSIKSSVNADLKRLYKDEKNPEGITIGPSNIFLMSNEAKDKLLTSLNLDEAVTLNKIAESLNVIKKVLSSPEALADAKSSEGPIKLEELRGTIQELAEKLGWGGEEPGHLPQASEDEQVEEVQAEEAFEEAEAEEVPAEDELDEEVEEVEAAAALDEAEAEEVDEGDADIVEEILAEEEEKPEEAEEIAEDEIEEVLEAVGVDEPLEEAEEDLDGAEVEADIEEVEDDAEIVDEAEVFEEVVPEGEEEIEGADEDEVVEAFEEAEVEEGPDEDRSVSFEQTSEAVHLIDEILSHPKAMADADSPDGLSKLEELRKTIEGLSQNLGMAGKEGEGDGEKEEGPKVVGPGTKGVAGDGDSGRGEVIAPEGALSAEGIEDEGDLEETVEEAAEAVDEAEVVEKVVPEEEEEIEEADEDEVVKDLQEAEVEEDLEEMEAEEVPAEDELDEEAEEVDEGDPLEDVEVIEDLDEGKYTGGADIEVGDGPQEMDLPVGSLGEELSDSAYEGDDGTRKNELLAEAFDGYLGAMERFYNQYLLIPQGEYIVGSKAPEKDEQPEHRVRLSPFYMGKFPVTNAFFEIFVEKTGYKTTAEKLGYATVYYGRLHKKVDEKTGLVKYTFNAAIRCETVYGACWYQPFGPDSTLYDKRNHPVVQVSLEDAMAFAAWTGKRLPTEDEWEAAARTADGRVFPWGNDMKGNSCNIEESSVADTTVVNKYIEFENDFGIVDAIGNVLEWTLDTCEPPSYVKNTSIYRIVKGGSWISDNDVRLFSRFRWNCQSPSNILGFRCVAF